MGGVGVGNSPRRITEIAAQVSKRQFNSLPFAIALTDRNALILGCFLGLSSITASGTPSDAVKRSFPGGSHPVVHRACSVFYQLAEVLVR